jgi:serine/threonine-protein kinase ULK/ATG1
VTLAKLNKKLKENLYGEIGILKDLHHPHIVALIDCRESTSHIHLVMEYCSLGDLSLFIKKRDKLISNPATADMARKYPNPVAGGLNEVIVRHFLKQIASALESLRALNLIHRDVKPQNLLLSPSAVFMATTPNLPKVMTASEATLKVPSVGVPSLPMLKVADFGFARSLPATSLAETLCGSPLYMAPEILRYEKYDAKADLWSVGTVLFEMMVGRPPFRANNHVELLRKIEQGDDIIKFSRESVVSQDMKALIRGLLKRNPVERMSFESFFSHAVVTEPIPGLLPEDRPQEARRASKSEGSQPMLRQASGSSARRAAASAETSTPPRRITEEAVVEEPESMSPQHLRLAGTPPTRPKADRTQTTAGVAPNEEVGQRRPSMPPSAATTPLAPTRAATARENPTPATRQQALRRASQDTSSPASSLITEQTPKPKKDRPREDQFARDERERAAQDVAFERDYVLVEKRAVEVNAFADEMAANPRLSGAQMAAVSPKNTLGRTNSTKRVPSSTATSPVTTTAASRAVQIAQGRRPTGTGMEPHQRTESFERRYGVGTSPKSATSAISKAIQGASLRLFGIGYTPMLGVKGQSPPPMYSPFPAYPATAGISGLISDGKLSSGGHGGGGVGVGVPSDEDARTVHVIEEAATISDVVYGFAEVKYKQLIPLAPSMDHGLGGHPLPSDPESSDQGLTPDATVALSEEALVLYVKALALLAKAMDIAGAWWAKKNRGEVLAARDGGSPRERDASVVAAGHRINSAVQWVRGRFNEVLEKAEVVRLKLLDAQRKAAAELDPSNTSNASSAGTHPGVGASSADGIVLTPGVTAEKLMYERAVEMSRSAAINEIANIDLPGCELSYVTAIRMLEAVLEGDSDTPSYRKRGLSAAGEEGRDEENVNGINHDDREAVEKGLSDIYIVFSS